MFSLRLAILGQILASISACKMKGLASMTRSWPQLQLSMIDKTVAFSHHTATLV